MSSHSKFNIKLHEAMTMKLEESFRAWHIPGFQVKCEDIPNDAKVDTTFVMKFHDGQLSLGVFWTLGSENDMITHTNIVAQASKLEEFQEKFPKLFEMSGSLYAFG